MDGIFTQFHALGLGEVLDNLWVKVSFFLFQDFFNGCLRVNIAMFS